MNLGAIATEVSLIVIFIFYLVVLWVVPYWFIFRKAGFAPTLSLLMMIPLVNIIMVFYFAFAEWPILKQQRGKEVT